MSRRLTTALAAFTVMVPLGLAATAFAGGESSGQSDKTEKSSPPGGASGGGGANSGCGAYCPTEDERRQGNGNAPQNGSVGKADSKNPPGQRPDGSDRNRGYECDRQTGVGDGNPAHTGCATGGTETSAPASKTEKARTPGKPAKTAKPAKPGKTAKPVSRGKAPKVAKPGKAGKPGKPGEAGKPGKAGRPGDSLAKAPGKTTICHATGSTTNPYVLITISNSALAAHRRHQHGEDIIPAPAGGCPGPDGTAPVVPGPAGPGKTTICHATGSSTNPYVMITIADAALAAHRRHQHGEDIIPAPAQGCPGPGSTGEGLPLVLGTVGGLPPLVDALRPGGRPGAAPPAGGVLGDFAAGGPGAAAPASAQGGPGAAAPASAQGGPDRRESGADAPAASGRLPFTGLELGIIAALGLATMLAGLALYRAHSRGAA